MIGWFVQFRLNAIRDDGIYIITKIIELVNMLKLVRLVCNEYNILYIDYNIALDA